MDDDPPAPPGRTVLSAVRPRRRGYRRHDAVRVPGPGADRRPVTPEAVGSSPIGPAIREQGFQSKDWDPFFFLWVLVWVCALCLTNRGEAIRLRVAFLLALCTCCLAVLTWIMCYKRGSCRERNLYYSDGTEKIVTTIAGQ